MKKKEAMNEQDAQVFYSKLSQKEREIIINFSQAKEALQEISNKQSITQEALFSFILTHLPKIKNEIFLPISIFSTSLTTLESIVKYLKEEKKFSLHLIAMHIGRDERNVWNMHRNANKKHPQKFIIVQANLIIPLSIFSQKPLSAQESIVTYLKDKLHYSYHAIAILLKRNDRTIWTVYHRSGKKNE